MNSSERERVNGDNEEGEVGNDALYKALSEGRYHDCRALLQRKDAARLVKYGDGDVTAKEYKERFTGCPVERRRRQGQTALHLACRSCVVGSAPFDVVRAIYSLRPQLVDRKDHVGMLPLHKACQFSSERVVEFLLTKAPHTAAVPDDRGSLPLHAAAILSRSPSVVEKILVAYPAVVRTAYLNGEILLHWFVKLWAYEFARWYPDLQQLRRRDMFEVDEEMDGLVKFKRTFTLLLTIFLRGTTVAEGSERLSLLHEAIRHENAIPIPTLVTKILVGTAPRTECARPDGQGNFPLHILCAKQGKTA